MTRRIARLREIAHGAAEGSAETAEPAFRDEVEIAEHLFRGANLGQVAAVLDIYRHDAAWEDAAALAILAKRLLHGWRTECNVAAATKLIDRLMEQRPQSAGELIDYSELWESAMLHRSLSGGDYDLGKARMFFRPAAERGHADA